PSNRERFQWLSSMIRSHKGEASVVEVQGIDNLPRTELVKRFNEARAREYQALAEEAEKISSTVTETRRMAQFGRIRRRFQEIVTIDFFQSPAQRRFAELIARLESGGEKGQRTLRKGHSELRNYQGKVWVTRPRPGIDRSACAWLIRRFIDTKARFAFAEDGNAPRAPCRSTCSREDSGTAERTAVSRR